MNEFCLPFLESKTAYLIRLAIWDVEMLGRIYNIDFQVYYVILMMIQVFKDEKSIERAMPDFGLLPLATQGHERP